MQDAKKRIGSRIKMYRELAGWTQEELAKMTGYAQQSIAAWENGFRTTSSEQLIHMAEIFGCTLDELCK